MLVFVFVEYCARRLQRVLTHSFPTRRSAVLDDLSGDRCRPGRPCRDQEPEAGRPAGRGGGETCRPRRPVAVWRREQRRLCLDASDLVEADHRLRSEEHTSELQSLMRISYAVFCLTKNKKNKDNTTPTK